MKKDFLPGGKGDKADPSDFDPHELEMGIEVEMEHTRNRKIAREIAMDHLSEDPRYYTKLRKIHKESRAMGNSAYSLKNAVAMMEDVNAWLKGEDRNNLIGERRASPLSSPKAKMPKAKMPKDLIPKGAKKAGPALRPPKLPKASSARMSPVMRSAPKGMTPLKNPMAIQAASIKSKRSK